MKYPDVTRITVVGPYGIEIEQWGLTDVSVQFQDEGRTMKIFYGKPLTATDEGVK